MDFDGDGLEDILSGSWPGDIHFFKATADRVFAAPVVIFKPPAHATQPGYSTLQSSALSAVDWDSDGDIDLVAGNIDGAVHLLLNEGTRAAPRFNRSTPLSADGRTIEVAGHKAGPCAADWDGDGRFDLVVGSEGGEVVWFRNTGTPQVPRFAAGEEVRPGGEEFREGFRYKVCVTDWNSDGLADLLIGTCQTGPRDEHAFHGHVWLCLREREEALEKRAPPPPRGR